MPLAETVTDLSCNDEFGFVSGEGSSDGSIYTYQWSGPGIIDAPSSLETSVNTTGTYSLEVTNTINGCTATTETEVIQSSDFPGVPYIDIHPPVCNGDHGTVIVFDVTGGSMPYLYSIDGGVTFGHNNMFVDLPSGVYEVIVQDAEGCEYIEEVSVPVVDELVVELEPSITLEFGATQQIQAQSKYSGRRDCNH